MHRRGLPDRAMRPISAFTCANSKRRRARSGWSAAANKREQKRWRREGEERAHATHVVELGARADEEHLKVLVQLSDAERQQVCVVHRRSLVEADALPSELEVAEPASSASHACGTGARARGEGVSRQEAESWRRRARSPSFKTFFSSKMSDK